MNIAEQRRGIKGKVFVNLEFFFDFLQTKTDTLFLFFTDTHTHTESHGNLICTVFWSNHWSIQEDTCLDAHKENSILFGEHRQVIR